MKALTFCLHLLDPVLASRTETGEENSAIGLNFIPGSALRGVFVDLYRRKYPAADLSTNDRARRLFFDHGVCFLNAYPWVADNRLLPKPMSWFVEKDDVDAESGHIFDFASGEDGVLEKPKAPNGQFCRIIPEPETVDEDEEDYLDQKEMKASVVLYSPARHLNVHIALENANYRDEQNKVYRYESLAEGEVLAGAIVSENTEDLELLQGLLERDLIQVGRANTAGYGRVRVSDAGIVQDWQEYALGDDPEDGRIIVTLLSDVLVRGKSGQVDGDFDAALASTLDMPELKAERSFRCMSLVGGFNRKWSLPLTQNWVLGAGSVYIYRSDSVDSAALWELSERGIGERRSEGFGRFAVNWHTCPKLERAATEKPLYTSIVLSQESRVLAQTMAQRRLRLLLDRKLAEAVNKTSLNPSQPQNAQLSRVRSATQEAMMQSSLKPLTDFLDGLKSAKDQFLRARVGTTRLFDWIRDRAEKPDVETELLGSIPLPDVAGERAELSEAVKIEYTARLIDGIAKKAIRENQRRDQVRRKAQ